MSFDLIFFKNKNSKITLDNVVSFFTKQKNFTIKPLDVDLYQFVYKNNETSVSFSIIYNEKNELFTDISFDDAYEFCYTYFSINYLRPSFYALEAMPIIENLSKTFDLYINDIQSLTEEKNTIKLYTTEELIDSYIKNNELTCIEFNKQYPLLSTTKEKSNYYYFYSLEKKKLNQIFNIDVPDISFIKNINNQSIYTVFSWDNLKGSLIPKCDYVFITRTYKGFLGLKKHKTSLIPFDEVIDIFSDMLEKIDHELDCYLFHSTDDEKTNQRFYELPEYDHDEFEVINLDEIVDVNL
ncbi:hypothetical protein KHQ81_04015 [Mycoplasmatota bacterium]|nr:hypothetical protein KHQ81_04015 [Mycoplasmatota bacterium]